MRIAVIGTGISGLGAAHLLRSRAEIVLYDGAARAGGHANTVDVGQDGRQVPVDTGFIVCNQATYPNFLRLLGTLGVATEPTDMSFSFSAAGGRFEYAGDTLGGLFAQRRNAFRPAHYGMLRDILRFYREAPGHLDAGSADLTLGDLLAGGGYGSGFVHDHLLPMGAAIWSCPTAEMLRFPARSFIRFFANHGLLSVRDRPVWRSVPGGSRRYVEALTAPFAGSLRLGTPVASLHRTAIGVVVRDAAGQEDRFDQVVVATHADQALALLAEATPLEREVLGAFRFQGNDAVLHDDPALMPQRKRAWASWNYLSEDRRGGAVSVTYWMNRLQPLPGLRPVFVSLNPFRAPRPGSVLARIRYDHPVFDHRALAAQAAIGTIQGRGGIWFCGAWCGYGFHEDGLAAGIAVAEALGARRPWAVEDMSPAAQHCRPLRPAEAA
ncbi:hypothetical protein E9232_000979 [Inquilinus ginsengisoli]|uniref:Amine oxidase domain-containing protein n=1 Tax=Inquilinus ginsengisoli TaxID=363840 RepID=A0ABU1JIM7_9PROT|nr:FAD-dependent oxidoreductase [Inquilinus ginsengisoli]MDR6288472.1 hypothetical protein [Inquilinus ginsengisoli]